MEKNELSLRKASQRLSSQQSFQRSRMQRSTATPWRLRGVGIGGRYSHTSQWTEPELPHIPDNLFLLVLPSARNRFLCTSCSWPMRIDAWDWLAATTHRRQEEFDQRRERVSGRANMSQVDCLVSEISKLRRQGVWAEIAMPMTMVENDRATLGS